MEHSGFLLLRAFWDVCYAPLLALPTLSSSQVADPSPCPPAIASISAGGMFSLSDDFASSEPSAPLSLRSHLSTGQSTLLRRTDS